MRNAYLDMQYIMVISTCAVGKMYNTVGNVFSRAALFFYYFFIILQDYLVLFAAILVWFLKHPD